MDGSRGRECSTCKALPGGPHRSPSGREASRTHEASLRPGRHGLISGEPRWEELYWALEAPVVNRFGSFAGQRPITRTATWMARDRRVVIEGRRSEARFEELV